MILVTWTLAYDVALFIPFSMENCFPRQKWQNGAGAWFGPSSQCIELIASKAKSGSIVYKEEWRLMSFGLWNFKEVGPDIQDLLQKIITLKINYCTLWIQGISVRQKLDMISQKMKSASKLKLNKTSWSTNDLLKSYS